MNPPFARTTSLNVGLDEGSTGSQGITSSRRDVPQDRRRTLMRRVAIVLFVAFSVWLLAPAFTSTHVEAFSARLQTMAMMDLRGQFTLDDQTYPVNVEYFYATRGGTVDVLEWIMRLTHSTGEINFRILMLASFVLFAASCILFVRQWTKEPVWAALIVLILTPGLVEVSFFFADNLPSAALAALALALINKRTPLWTWFVAGAILALGCIVRVDAIVAAPSLAMLALLRQDFRWKRLFADWIVGFAGAAAVFTLHWRMTTVSLRQSLLIGKWIGAIHISWHQHERPWIMLVLFFGWMMLILIPIGVVYNWKREERRWNLVMAVYPALFYPFFLVKTFELRDFLLLGAPFVLLQGATGLTCLLRALEFGPQKERRWGQAAIAFYLLTLVLPPMIYLHDGPRTTFGRLWSPNLWWRWQGSIKDGMNQIDQLIASARPGDRVLVLSILFQADRYLHLELLKNGYDLLPASTATPCGEGVETYRKDGITFYHVRTENPYTLLNLPPASLYNEYQRGYQVEAGLKCLKPADYDRAYMMSWGSIWMGYLALTPEFLRDSRPTTMPFPEHVFWTFHEIKPFGLLRITPLSREDMVSLLKRTDEVMISYPYERQDPKLAPHSYAEFHHDLAPRYWPIPQKP